MNTLEAKAFLQKQGISYTIRKDGLLLVKRDIDLSFSQLKKLPDLSCVILAGSFRCGYNVLTTLTGAPRYVSGNFLCHGNNLISLVGAPKFVGGDFFCQHNKLSSLANAPRKFKELTSDLGTFQNHSAIPKNLLHSIEKERAKVKAYIDKNMPTKDPIPRKRVTWKNRP